MAAVMLDAALDDDLPDLGPATAVAVGLIASALVANAWLIHQGFAPLTALAQTPMGRAFRRYFDAHCDGQLAVDLFSIAGRFVPVRRLP